VIRGTVVIRGVSWVDADSCEVGFTFAAFSATELQTTDSVEVGPGVTGLQLYAAIVAKVKAYVIAEGGSWNDVLDSVQILGGLI
jgi:hypothetical protein